MPWLAKVLLIAVLLGGLVFLAAAVPSLPARLGFLAAAGFVFLWAMRDPALAYRRALHLLIVVPFVPLGFSASAQWFGAQDQPSAIVKIIIDSSQAIPPWLLLALAAICLVGDLYVTGKDRSQRKQIYEATEIEAKIIEDRKLVQIEFPFRPPSAVAVSGAEIELGGIGRFSDDVETWVRIGGDSNEATANNPQTVDAGAPASIMVRLTLKEPEFQRLQRGRQGLRRFFSASGTLRLRTETGLVPVPIRLP